MLPQVSNVSLPGRQQIAYNADLSGLRIRCKAFSIYSVQAVSGLVLAAEA